jgi:hypothetical protein
MPLLEQTVFATQLSRSISGKTILEVMLEADFEPKIEEENFIDEAVLGALEECTPTDD